MSQLNNDNNNKENIPPLSFPSKLNNVILNNSSVNKKSKRRRRKRAPLRDITNLFLPHVPPPPLPSLDCHLGRPQKRKASFADGGIDVHQTCRLSLRKEFR